MPASVSIAAPPAPSPAASPNPRLERMLRGPVGPVLARLAAPNVAVVAAMTAVTVADAWFVSRIGIAALASLALVFPLQTLMQMMSAGAMGGGVSSAVARALGGGRHERADAIVLHASVIALGMALLFVLFGAVLARPLVSLLGGEGAVLEGAVAYASIAFGGAAAMWLANTFASVLRGTGNMATPAAVLILTSLMQIGLSGALTLGWGPFPVLGIRGPAVALVSAFTTATLIMGLILASGRAGVRLRLAGIRMEASLFADILKVGALACGNAVLTIGTVLVVTRLVAAHGAAELAGYGLGSRLELMLVPISFGVGGALTAAVGLNFGARQFARARRIAWSGALLVAAITGLIGATAAIRPDLWLDFFTVDADAHFFGSIYLGIVGPFYGLFGLGMALYFASQGTGNMVMPFSAGVVRLCLTAGSGILTAAWLGAGAEALFVCVAVGLAAFGGLIAFSMFGRNWNPDR